MNKTLLYFKTWMKATGRNLVSAKVLSLVVLLSAFHTRLSLAMGAYLKFRSLCRLDSDCFRYRSGSGWHSPDRCDGYFESVERRGDRRER